MYAQLTMFEGPRSPELVAAAGVPTGNESSRSSMLTPS